MSNAEVEEALKRTTPPGQGHLLPDMPACEPVSAVHAPVRRVDLKQRLRATFSFVCQAVALVLLAIVVIAVVAIVADDPEPGRSASQSASMRFAK
jgi:hypothetical protein